MRSCFTYFFIAIENRGDVAGKHLRVKYFDGVRSLLHKLTFRSRTLCLVETPGAKLVSIISYRPFVPMTFADVDSDGSKLKIAINCIFRCLPLV